MKYLTAVNDKTYLIEINDDRHVVVDGKVVHAGGVPGRDKIEGWL